MFGRKRKRTLVEYEPAELSLELLSIMQQSLMVKLLQSNRELEKRYGVMVEAGRGLLGADDENINVIANFLERLKRIDTVLEIELERAARFRQSQAQGTPGK